MYGLKLCKMKLTDEISPGKFMSGKLSAKLSIVRTFFQRNSTKAAFVALALTEGICLDVFV